MRLLLVIAGAILLRTTLAYVEKAICKKKYYLYANKESLPWIKQMQVYYKESHNPENSFDVQIAKYTERISDYRSKNPNCCVPDRLRRYEKTTLPSWAVGLPVYGDNVYGQRKSVKNPIKDSPSEAKANYTFGHTKASVSEAFRFSKTKRAINYDIKYGEVYHCVLHHRKM